MELNLYDVIVKPVASNKTYRLYQAHKKVVFEVHMDANKPLVHEAVTKIFNVEIDSVRIMIRKGKRRVSRSRNMSVDAKRKIAIVTLKNNSELNVFGDVAAASNAHGAKHNAAETTQAKD